MGSLQDFLEYLQGRRKLVTSIEGQLSGLLEKYETFFGEITKVREHELQQLREYMLRDGDQLPAELQDQLQKVRRQVEHDLDTQLAALREQQEELIQKAERIREHSRVSEDAVRARNRNLDEAEEKLKGRSQDLLVRIKEYNGRIKGLASGFGFVVNVLQMRRLQAEREELDEDQASLAARIETLRAQWRQEEQEHTEQEGQRQERWVEHTTEAGALRTKIDYLEAARPRLLERSTIERVLYGRVPGLPQPKLGDPACSRCDKKNPPEFHFCHTCARRLREDQPDLEGSLDEIAELNLHHDRFSEGLQATQEILGLVRGLGSGLDAFMTSVEDMVGSENRYPLPKMEIKVPTSSRQYGKHLDELLEEVSKDQSLHPALFARRVQDLAQRVFTEDHIKDYFETMGEELTQQAESQW